LASPTDTRGRPALLLRAIGQGSLVLCTYPVEHMAALTPRVNPDDMVTLYDALARHAGVRRLVTADDPRVSCDTLIRDDGVLSPSWPATPPSSSRSSQPCPARGRADQPGRRGDGEGVETGKAWS
jgi:hypothetical protein